MEKNLPTHAWYYVHVFTNEDTKIERNIIVLGKVFWRKNKLRKPEYINPTKPSLNLHGREEFISTALKNGGWVDSEDWREGLTARAAWQPDGYHRDWDRKQELAHLLLLLRFIFIPSVFPPSSTRLGT